MQAKKNKEQTELFASMIAQKQGWVVGNDKELIDMLIEGLTVNFNRYGYFLCPCRDTSGSRELDKSIICPCEYARADIAEYGHCYCSLYYSREFADSGMLSSGIPERRFKS